MKKDLSVMRSAPSLAVVASFPDKVLAEVQILRDA